MRTLDPGTMGGDTGRWAFLLAMLAVTLGGIFIVSTLIGVLTTGLEGKLDELRKGRSLVIETDHTVILGWSPQIFTIVTELVAGQREPAQAAHRDPGRQGQGRDGGRDPRRVPDTGTTRIVCRTRQPDRPRRPGDRQPARPRASIIVLAPETDDPDADVIKTILAITNNPQPPAGAVPHRGRDPRPAEPGGRAAWSAGTRRSSCSSAT